ncbi:hypothetical protein A7P95_01025 [Eikenella longinqua]|uniref:Uncharacterized protein n=1 Tax=Eikenella longinqua TaxID=1795827 RepID=A0A1A9S2V5_9NEIS|nr:hypothetical protein A7P95_01025 [Eikenella longinqua]
MMRGFQVAFGRVGRRLWKKAGIIADLGEQTQRPAAHSGAVRRGCNTGFGRAVQRGQMIFR